MYPRKCHHASQHISYKSCKNPFALHESESKRSNGIANKRVFGRFNKIFDVNLVDIEAFKLVCFDANPQF